MYAVGISLGSSSAIVAVSSVEKGQTPTPIEIVSNSAGQRITPAMAAFSLNGELVFGHSAREAYVRSPNVVVPYLFAFAAVAAVHRRCQCNSFTDKDGNQSCVEDESVMTLQREIENVAEHHYKGYSPFLNEGGNCAQRLGFSCLNTVIESQNGVENDEFITAENLLVRFLNYVKKHTVDAVCEMAANSNESLEKEQQLLEKQKKIILTVVVPRYLFPEAIAVQEIGVKENEGDGSNSNDNDFSNSNNNNITYGKTAKRNDALSWVREAIFASNFAVVAAHVSVLFADEAAICAMDALSCRPHLAHPMAERYFLLPPSAAEDCVATSPWPQARVLVVDWGALGVSMTRLCLEGGCLVDEPRPLFLFSTHTVAKRRGKVPGLALASCGGGDAVTSFLSERVAATFAQQKISGLGYVSLKDFPARAQRRLRIFAEEKKVALSRAMRVSVEIEALVEGVDLRDNTTFTRTRVDAALRGEWNVLEAFEKVLEEYINLLKKKADGVIDVVVLCGGMLCMPFIAESLRRIFTQRALMSEVGHRCFSQKLVIMEADRSTTVFASSPNGANVPCFYETTANKRTLGAEELLCTGGCLHSCQLALAAIQKHEYLSLDRSTGGKAKKLGFWRRRERAEGALRVWNALTNSDGECTNDDCLFSNEIIFLQCPIFLYTHTNLEFLRLAVAQQPEEDAPLQLPTATLTVLFSPHTSLPARVIVPLREKSSNDYLFYLFLGAPADNQHEGKKFAGADAFCSVFPLSETGVRLSAINEENEGEELDYCVIFTLSGCEGGSTQPSQQKNTSTALQLLLQLVCFTANTSPPLVLTPANVRASATIDISV